METKLAFIIVNMVLAGSYAILGRIPTFKNGIVYNEELGLAISLLLFVYVVVQARGQYVSGSVARPEIARQYFWRTRKLPLMVVVLPVVFLALHSAFGFMETWWGNLAFGVLVLISCAVYYSSFATFREANPANVGRLWGIKLPDVPARKTDLLIFVVGGVKFGTIGTFLAAQWGLAALTRGAVQILSSLL